MAQSSSNFLFLLYQLIAQATLIITEYFPALYSFYLAANINGFFKILLLRFAAGTVLKVLVAKLASLKCHFSNGLHGLSGGAK